MTVTVLSGPERRRRWTTAEKLRLVEETLTPEANIAAVARQHDLHPNLLHAWRQQARSGALAAHIKSKPTPGQSAGFVAVRLAPERPVVAATPAPSGAGLIEVEFANGSRIRVTGAVDPAILVGVLAVMASDGGRK